MSGDLSVGTSVLVSHIQSDGVQGNIEICSYNAVRELHPNSLPNPSPSEICRIQSFSIRLSRRHNKCTKVMCTHDSNNYRAITIKLHAARDMERSSRSNRMEIDSRNTFPFFCVLLNIQWIYGRYTNVVIIVLTNVLIDLVMEESTEGKCPPYKSPYRYGFNKGILATARH